MRIWLEGGEKGVRIGIRIGVVGLDGLDWDRGGGSGLMMMGVWIGLVWIGLDYAGSNRGLDLDRMGAWEVCSYRRGRWRIGVGDGELERT